MLTEALTLLGYRAGAILVSGKGRNLSHQLALDCGDTLVRFQPSEVDPASLLIGQNLLSRADSPAEPAAWVTASPSAGITIARNINRQWAVEGTEPWFLAAAPGVRHATVAYVDPDLGESIPVTPGVEYEASGYFAALGAEGNLRLAVLDRQGVVIDERLAALSTKFRGGTKLSDFQPLRLRMTMPTGAVAVRYEVEFTGHVEGSKTLDATAFILFARCRLAAWPRRKSAAWSALPGVAPAIAQLTIGEGSLLEATVDIEGAAGERSLAVVALDDADAEPLAVFPLPDVSAVVAAVGPVQRNALKVSVNGYSRTLRLYIDGEPAGTIPEKLHHQRRRRERMIIPQRFCDGRIHVVELRDATDTRVLARGAEVFPWVTTSWATLQQHSSPPLPFQLAPAAAHRYQSLRDALERVETAVQAGDGTGDMLAGIGRLSALHRVLELGFDRLPPYEPLPFPRVEKPKVSVVVPVHNKFNVTYYCLAALLFAANDTSFEVVVVDDGSSDDTDQLARLAPNVTICRNETAQGFVRACNLGVENSRGEYVVLLNNDTEPTLGWLDELLRAFDRFEAVGIAGSKLLYPDGRLQDAGGIVWGSGNPWNYGNGANPHDPRFNYARQADYLSGAALMLPRNVWDEVGGLSEEFVPAYFEDTDLAFKVRDKGYTTWYVPSSVVYHFLGISNGTDVTTTTGLKRFQEVNRPKFKRKWAQVFKDYGAEAKLPDLQKDRGIIGRALFIDTGIPRPDRDAGSYAALQEMRLVQSLGYKVTFMPMNLAYLGGYYDELNKLGIETIHSPFCMAVEDFLRDRGGEFDVVYITRYHVANKVIEQVRELAPQAKVLFCNADLHFLREMRAAVRSGDENDWKRAETIREEELLVMREADVVLSYNEVEHSVILSHNMLASTVMTCPWVVETRPPDDVPDFHGREGIAFLGGYLHPPNIEAVEFFVEEVVPRLREELPGVMFNIYGSSMPERFAKMADETVRPVGYVDRVEEVYDTNRLFVAPLFTGAGIKGKVLGALAHGIPCILSPVAVESTGVRDGYDCVVAHDLDDWVSSIVRLYDDPVAWTKMSLSAREFTKRQYSFENGRVLMRRAFEAAGVLQTRP